MNAAIRASEIHSGYGEMEIVRGVSISVAQGSVYALMGKNGAGKTTFLKSVLGLLPLMSGETEILGQRTTGMPSHKLIGKMVTYAPQEGGIFVELTVDENLRLGARGMRRSDLADRMDHVRTLFPILGARREQRAGTLSGGEQGMLKVARCLLSGASIVVLDEISEGIQPSIIEHIAETLRHERTARQVTVVLVEQNLDFAMSLATGFGVMEGGSIVEERDIADPSAKELIASHLEVH